MFIMTKRNPHIARLSPNYLFPEINLRKRQFLNQNPHAHLISLGIGDTTEPIPPLITQALTQGAAKLGSLKGYSGYGPEQGEQDLREQIASRIYQNRVSSEDIFISDGAKCDLGRIQILFGGQVSIAVQDPAYPVYIDGSIMQGVQTVVPMPCNPENNFFPDLNSLPKTDLIYFCSPNNPTGAAATKSQLQQLVAFAKANRSVIIFDSAYANYIQDPSLPKSIFEIDGAHEVAIELGSFSKIAGFTGVRLGWSVVPEALKFDDGASIKADWKRVMSTIFNGASNISQNGGKAILTDAGWQEISALTAFYMENTRLIRETLQKLNYEIFGGENAPYLWVRFKGRHSWDLFQEFLEKFHVVTTPGIGFGPEGEGFIRLTAFGHRENVLQALERISRPYTNKP